MISDVEFEQQFRLLQQKYEQSGEEDDLAALIWFTDRHVEYEKRYMKYRVSAYSKLKMLEDVIELKGMQLYRKAVLLFTLRQKYEAFLIFMKLIRGEHTEDYISERAIGYILVHFEEFLPYRERIPLLSRLEESEDPIALQLLEQVDVTQIYAEEEQADLIDFEEYEAGIESEWKVFTSDQRQWEPVHHKRAQDLWMRNHRVEQYDLYLDFVSERYYLSGELCHLSTFDARILAKLALHGSNCDIADLYKTKYGEPYDPADTLSRNRIDKVISRLRKKISNHGIQLNRHVFNPGTTFCLLCPESLVRDWES